MLGKKKEPSMNDRLTDIESYFDKVSDTLESIIKRLECIELEIDEIKLDKKSIKANIKYMQSRLGLPA